ncbi:MAG TPA: hypothetical protein VF477_06070 [Mycobacterium sp.]
MVLLRPDFITLLNGHIITPLHAGFGLRQVTTRPRRPAAFVPVSRLVDAGGRANRLIAG